MKDQVGPIEVCSWGSFRILVEDSNVKASSGVVCREVKISLTGFPFDDLAFDLELPGGVRLDVGVCYRCGCYKRDYDSVLTITIWLQ